MFHCIATLLATRCAYGVGAAFRQSDNRSFISEHMCAATRQWHIWSLFALYGIYFGCVEAPQKAFIADLVPSELRASAYGVYHFAFGIAAFPASFVMGALWQTLNPTVAFTFGAALSLIAMVLLILAIPTHIPNEKGAMPLSQQEMQTLSDHRLKVGGSQN